MEEPGAARYPEPGFGPQERPYLNISLVMPPNQEVFDMRVLDGFPNADRPKKAICRCGLAGSGRCQRERDTRISQGSTYRDCSRSGKLTAVERRR